MNELVVDIKPEPGDSSAGSGTAMGPVVVPVFAAGLLAKFVAPAAGLAALVVGVAAFLVTRKPREGRFVLRVVGDRLELARERRPGPPVSFPLSELANVTLDRRTRAAGASSAERVRLAFEHGGTVSYVPEEHTTPMEAQEWLAKVRLFLRSHGWLPADERDAQA